MKVSEIPYEKLSVGDIIISALNHKGEIVELYPEDDKSLEIVWENGNASYAYHHQCDKIEYVGKED